MSKINLNIIGSNSFFRILKELTLDNVIFDINVVSLDNVEPQAQKDSYINVIFAEQVSIIELRKLLLYNIPTVLLLNNKTFLVKNKLRLLDYHLSLVLPLEILSFKEILNILITKYNFFKKSKIIIKDYEIDSNRRLIIKNGMNTKLTEKELQLILTLNKENGLHKSALLKRIWNHNLDLESHAFETQLHRLRKKINNIFKDNKFVTEKNSRYYLLVN
jgi:DNA-binding response OmpR family regulator